jgi:hypothetical protein
VDNRQSPGWSLGSEQPAWKAPLDEGGFVSTVVDPDGLYLRKNERFVGRGPERFSELKPNEDPHGADDFLSS